MVDLTNKHGILREDGGSNIRVWLEGKLGDQEEAKREF